MSAPSAAARATALVSEPPRPSVVMLPSASTPWNPATTATVPAASVSRRRSASMRTMRARPYALSVSMRTWWPRNERAGTPRSCRTSAVSADVTCSPVEASTSLSRSAGRGCAALASASRRLVSPAMAETTTATWCPAACVRWTRPATCRMRSRSATDVPPNFCTMRATDPFQTSLHAPRAARSQVVWRGPCASSRIDRLSPAPYRRVTSRYSSPAAGSSRSNHSTAARPAP